MRNSGSSTCTIDDRCSLALLPESVCKVLLDQLHLPVASLFLASVILAPILFVICPVFPCIALCCGYCTCMVPKKKAKWLKPATQDNVSPFPMMTCFCDVSMAKLSERHVYVGHRDLVHGHPCLHRLLRHLGLGCGASVMVGTGHNLGWRFMLHVDSVH